ncbi:MAG: hypothetical protein L0Y58_04000 [Verrucomicrobia subdivision 3 bacterium]|nr:hypothetical protein [Limisphaerales bacterium]
MSLVTSAATDLMAMFGSVIERESPEAPVSFKQNENSLKEIGTAAGLHWQQPPLNGLNR